MSSPPHAEPTASEAPKDPEIDVDIDAEMTDTQPASGPNANGASSSNIDPDYPPQQDNQPATSSPHHNRKDATLREFLSKMDDYAPVIPDAVTAHYLTLAGLPPPSPSDPTGARTNTTPLPLARLLALATQKFIADVAADAYQYSRTRTGHSASSNPLGSTAPGQPGAGGAGGGAAGKAAQQQAQLGVQRSGYGGGGQGGSGQGKTVLTMEDLGMAVQEYGINVKRGEFYR